MLQRHISALIVLLIALSAVGVTAQNATPTNLEKGVFWSDPEAGVEAFLFRGNDSGFRLTVVTEREVTVTYRTAINSMQDVTKELPFTESARGAIRYFSFDHRFSRTTIWMALDFTVAGKPVPALTRTFYNSIFETVPNDQFPALPKITKAPK